MHINSSICRFVRTHVQSLSNWASLGSSQEELEDVDLHEQDRDQHGVADMAKGLVLLHSKAQDPESPSHHAHSAVGPGLQVKALANPRIQLHA